MKATKSEEYNYKMYRAGSSYFWKDSWYTVTWTHKNINISQ